MASYVIHTVCLGKSWPVLSYVCLYKKYIYFKKCLQWALFSLPAWLKTLYFTIFLSMKCDLFFSHNTVKMTLAVTHSCTNNVLIKMFTWLQKLAFKSLNSWLVVFSSLGLKVWFNRTSERTSGLSVELENKAHFA